MASAGLNKWIVSGNLAADAQVKTVELRDGEKAQVASATLYVRKFKNRKESFTVSLSIWDNSVAWRKLPFLKKGSLIICTGSVEANPYFANSDNTPRAGLEMTVLDIDLDIVRDGEEESESVVVQPAKEVQKSPAPSSAATPKQPATTAAKPAATTVKAAAPAAKAPAPEEKAATKA